MPSHSKKIRNCILPIGFAVIIILMVTSAFITSNRIQKNQDTISSILIETNKINHLLDSMSTAEHQRTVILFEIFQNQGLFRLEEYSSALNQQAIKLANARATFAEFDLSQKQKDLLALQEQMAKHSLSTNKNLISLLNNENYKLANLILRNITLPKIRQKQEVISDLHNEIQITTKQKVQAIEDISSKEAINIFTFNLVFILASLFLMFYLIKKQNENVYNLSVLAHTDKLTELPNRDSFIKSINETIEKDPDFKFSIVFLDVDYFKSINDNYGHEVGDLVLKLFSDTINKNISDVDILSRFGGDEFVLLIRHGDNLKRFNTLIRGLSKALDTSFKIDDDEVFISASIGVCTYPSDGSDAKSLLKSADIAMYAAKQNGRNCYQFYSLNDSNKLDYEHSISHALQTILKNINKDNQLTLEYQPLVNIDDNKITECEALIRWTDHNGKTVNTSDFIEIAEKSNLIEKINTFVIKESCRQQAKWQQLGVCDIRININLSGNKRIFKQLFKTLSHNLEKYDLDPKLFGIELTERTMYEISEETYNDLDHFRNMGMKISIDDFGTGYSSLSYLKKLPITSVKIDREFITGLPENKVDVALVKAIITLARSLDFDVVAEGIETQEQYDFLKSCKCNIAQGYLLHKPMKSDGITKLSLVA